MDIDIVLRAGGVELSGVVADLTGGTIAHAHVSVISGTAAVTAETNGQGRFAMWVAPGWQPLRAVADGYAEGHAGADAPGTIEILMTPESTVAGKVVDAATGQPIEGARVEMGLELDDELDDLSTISSAQGEFRFTRLMPGRVVVVARTAHGHGRSSGSLLIGLGQHVEGMVIKLFPARQITGTVVIATTRATCAKAGVTLRDQDNNRWARLRRTDDALVADGVLPGTYTPTVWCNGFQSRDTYEPVVVADKNLTGLEWEVVPGATIRGKVITNTGEPVENALIWSIEGRRAGIHARSQHDGSYELAGVGAGYYVLAVKSDRGIAAPDGYDVMVGSGAVVDRDLVVDNGGTIKGTIVDSEGKPIAHEDIAITSGSLPSLHANSDEAGAFTVRAVRPGDYHVETAQSWSDSLRTRGTDQIVQHRKPTVVVRANQTSVTRLVAGAKRGTIKGSVIDANGKPIADAFVVAVHESKAAGASRELATRLVSDQRPVVTATDGTFVLTNLSAGQHVVRVYRRGGGDVIADHVAVDSTIALQIRATGSLAGTVRHRGGAIADELTITVENARTGLSRQERYFQTQGHYTVRDLPKGEYVLLCETSGGWKRVEIGLAEGEPKTVDLELDSLITVTGRVVDLHTRMPVSGIEVTASPSRGAPGFRSYTGDHEDLTNSAGRFTFKRVPSGRLELHASPKNNDSYDHGISAVRDVDRATGTLDLGDIAILKSRVTGDQATGVLGFELERQRRVPFENYEHKVSGIEPDGPAAKTKLEVGDVITTVDGIDVSGVNSSNFQAAVAARPGTTLTLGLARGVTVTITLSAPEDE